METPQLRKILDEDQIFNSLLSMIRLRTKVLLWQNGERGRDKCWAALLKINRLNNILEMVISGDQSIFSKNDLIYFYCEFRKTIFKTKILYQSPNKLLVEIPTQFMAIENRVNHRKNLASDEDDFNVDFYLNLKDEKGPIWYKRKAFDISNYGISLRINRAEAGRFFEGDEIGVILKERVGGKESLGHIRYITRHFEGNSSNEFYRVGVVWNKELLIV